MAQKVGGILLEILTNTAKVRQDFDEIKKNISKFSKDAKKILRTVGITLGAAFSVRAIKSFIVEGVKTIDTLQDMSQSAGIASRAFQGLVQASKYAGVEQTGVATAVRRLNTVIRDANTGLAESVRLFEDLGIEYQDANNQMRGTLPVLYDIADRFAVMEDGSLKSALAQKALGRSGADLIPVLNQSSEGLEKVTDRLERLGGIVTDETMEKMDRVNQNIVDLAAATSAVKLQVLAGMADYLERITKTAVDNAEAGTVLEKIGKFIGFIGVQALSAGAGLAWMAELWMKFISMLAAEVSLGPKHFLDPEVIKMMGQELDAVNKKWNGIITSLKETPKETPKKITEEVKEMKKIFDAIDSESVWGNMQLGFEKYHDSIIDRNKQIQDAVVSGMKTMEDALVNFVVKGKMEWASLRDAILSDIARILIRQRLIAPLVKLVTPGPSVEGITGPVTSPLPRRRGRISASYSESAATVSNDLRNIVAENTYVMTRDVEYFVESSERQFERLGRVLRNNLYLSGRAGIFDPGGIPVTGTPNFGGVGIGGGAAPGAVISGEVIAGGGIDLGPIGSVGEAIRNPTPATVAEAIKDTNIITVATDVAADIVEEVVKDVTKKAVDTVKNIPKSTIADTVKNTNVIAAATTAATTIAESVTDAVFGEGTADKIVDESTDFLKSIADKLAGISGNLAVTMPGFSSKSGINQAANIAMATNLITGPLVALSNLFHQGGTVGSLFRIPRLHKGLAPDEMLAVLQRGEEVIPKQNVGGGRNLTINVPVTVGDQNSALARELRAEIEKTVIDVLRRYA